MVNACFDKEMKNILKEMIGKTFKSYEYSLEDRYNPMQFLRINMGTFAIDFSNEQKPVEFFGANEDVAYFSCVKVKLTDKFPYGIETKEYMIDEKVKDVQIVTDIINVNDGEYEIKIDQALIIFTNYNVYSFSKGWMFDEEIKISKDRKDINVYDIENVKKDWSDSGQDKVCVTRSYTSLKTDKKAIK